MTTRKFTIPDTAPLDEMLRNIIQPIKEGLEQVAGRRGVKVSLLTRNANTGDIVGKVNQLIELLQDTPVPTGPLAGARASEWIQFVPTVTGSGGGTGTITDHGCAWRVADRTAYVLYDFVLTAGALTGFARASFPNDLPMPWFGQIKGFGRESVMTGSMLSLVGGAGRTIELRRYDNAAMITVGYRFSGVALWPTQ